MKILYVLQEFPYPLTEGAVVKVFNIIAHMATRHECHLMSFGDGDLEERAAAFCKVVPGVRIKGLFSKCSGVGLQMKRIAGFFQGKPVFLWRWQSERFQSALKKQLESENYDLVHLDALAMAPYIDLLTVSPVVISTTNAVSLAYREQARATSSLFRRLHRMYESRRIASFEKKVLPRFAKVHVVSAEDKSYLDNFKLGIRTEHIVHGVPDSVLNYQRDEEGDNRVLRKVLLTGGLLNAPAVAKGVSRFLELVYPCLANGRKDIALTIVGRCASKQLQAKIASIPGISYREWIDDYCAALLDADVVILTDQSGTGIKTRLLYALSLGRAVVASPAAAKGFDFIDGVHLLRRELDVTFAEAIIKLLSDQDLRVALSTNAKELIRLRFSMDYIGTRWEGLYLEALVGQSCT